jgi:Type I phosphodiesterase / nucleotide pyrophosphatase
MGICRRQFGSLALSGLTAGAFAAPLRPPKLLVLIILEQFRPDLLDTVLSRSGQGGFRKLLYKGAHFPDCRHLASTFPASSLATLATGAWPSQHGIVAGTWFDRAAKNSVAASSEALQATTLCEQVARAGNRVFVVANDLSTAALFAGTPEAHLYWINETGQFATLGELPAWLANYNLAHPIAAVRDFKWTAIGAGPGAPPLRTLTYDPRNPREFMALYNASPVCQTAQFAFLTELMARERIGQGETQDLLCLLDGTSSLLGYETGGNSPLMPQMALHLDQQLEGLLNRLGITPGENAFNLVLAGAHGAPPLPAADSRARMAVNGETIAQAVDKALIATGAGRVTRYVYPFLYLDSTGFRDPEPIRQAAGRAALDLAPVAGYYTAGGGCSTHDGWEVRFRNSFHPKRSGDVMLAYCPEYVEDFGQARGVSYGSLYNYDVRVPLCFYGPQCTAEVFDSPVESVDVAPTLARVMGVAQPSSASGRVLGEAFAE